MVSSSGFWRRKLTTAALQMTAATRGGTRLGLVMGHDNLNASRLLRCVAADRTTIRSEPSARIKRWRST